MKKFFIAALLIAATTACTTTPTKRVVWLDERGEAIFVKDRLDFGSSDLRGQTLTEPPMSKWLQTH